MTNSDSFSGMRKHSDRRYSVSGFDESKKGRDKLVGLLTAMLETHEALACFCERPLQNESVEVLLDNDEVNFRIFPSLSYDDFELSFDWNNKNQVNLEATKALMMCFYFFQHYGCVFVENSKELNAIKSVYKENQFSESINLDHGCSEIYKSVEDDVIWISANDQFAEWLEGVKGLRGQV